MHKCILTAFKKKAWIFNPAFLSIPVQILVVVMATTAALLLPPSPSPLPPLFTPCSLSMELFSQFLKKATLSLIPGPQSMILCRYFLPPLLVPVKLVNCLFFVVMQFKSSTFQLSWVWLNPATCSVSSSLNQSD